MKDGSGKEPPELDVLPLGEMDIPDAVNRRVHKRTGASGKTGLGFAPRLLAVIACVGLVGLPILAREKRS